MSRLRELIAELCPDGVEYKTLGKVAPFVRERANTDEARFDAYVGVDALLQNKKGRDLTKTGIPSGRHIYFRPGDTLVGNIRPYLKKIWYADCFGGTNGDVLVFRSTGKVEAKYLYHVLASDAFFDYDNGHARGSKMPRGDKGFIRDYRIPVPPIEVQREIVHILDSFQELDDALTAEIEAREKQLRCFVEISIANWMPGGVSEAPMCALNTVCELIRAGGDAPSDCVRGVNAVDAQHPYPVYSNGTGENALYGFSGGYAIKDDAVTIAARGSIGFHTVRRGKFTPVIRLITLVPSGLLLVEYLDAALDSCDLTGTRASISQLTVPMIKAQKIPIPSLEDQRVFVGKLNELNRYRKSICSEREARRKQFAYYRDKLLALPELNKEVDK